MTVTDCYGLSFMQESMLFGVMKSDNRGLYLQQYVFEFGAIDVETYMQAWRNVIAATPSLRTEFDWSNGEILQRARDAVDDPIRRLPYRDLGEASPILAFLEQDRRRGVDLSRAPLMRVTIIEKDRDHCWAVWTVHHLLVDGWSAALITMRVAETYEFLIGRRSSAGSATSTPPPFREFVEWQRGRASDADARAHWRRALRDFPAPDPLPLDFEPTTADGGPPRRGRISVDLPAGGAERLRRLASSLRVSTQTLFYAAWALTLSTVSGRRDIVFGSIDSGRAAPLAGIENMIGVLTQTVPMRVRIHPEQTLRDLVHHIHESLRSSTAFSCVAPAELREAAGLAPGAPLFDSLLTSANVGVEEGAGLALVRSLKSAWAVDETDVPLGLVVRLATRGEIAIDYDEAKIRAGTASALLDRARLAIDAMAANMALPVHEVLGADDGRGLAIWSSAVGQDPEDGRALEVRFLAHAASDPDRPAIVEGETTLSYGELAVLASNLAELLRRRGLAPGDLAAVCFAPSSAFLVAVLAVLLCGAGYVPIDPLEPRERIGKKLGRARVRIVLHGEGIEWTGGTSAPSVRVDAPLLGRLHAGSQHPASTLSLACASSAAYVLFTSGSTGEPKGVWIDRSALMSYARWATTAYDLRPGSRVALHGSMAFDLSITSSLVPLYAGATIVIAAGARAVDQLLWTVRAGGFDLLKLTPSQLSMVNDLSGAGDLRGWTRTLVVGGELLRFEHLGRIANEAPGTLVVNEYGPTESTVGCTAHPVDLRAAAARGPVPIGTPIAGASVYVLSPELRPVPAGGTGELYVAGAGLAVGYHADGGQTAARFLPHPLANRPGARMYATGDIVRVSPDRTLVYLGRSDTQLKINGFRVEPAEVESALRRHADLRSVAVIGLSRNGSPPALAAFLVPRDGARPTPSGLRRFLAEGLPDYMVPTTYHFVQEIPTHLGGKLDEATLRRMAEPTPASASASPVSGTLEQKVLDAWRVVLGRLDVGLDDPFFEIGGDSLRAALVIGRLRREHRLELTLPEFFGNPTVRSQANALSRDEISPAAVVRARADGSGPPRFAIVGMAGRFPKSESVTQLWANLLEGVDGISFFDDADLREAGVDEALLANPRYVRAGGRLAGEGLFDADFFGISPREAELTDPQHRVFLEVCWSALEDAGCDPSRFQGRIGVYAGCGPAAYLRHSLSKNRSATDASELQITLGNQPDFLPLRVSYKLGLRGPSVCVLTACSTSLVAVHLACQAIASGECDMAIAGGVSIGIPQTRGYLYESGSIRSPDGHCRAFDHRAEGTVGASGAAAVVIMPLARARESNHPIHAIILGSAVNNDARRKVGFTAPSLEAQAEAIADALRKAAVSPATIGLVEAHGTATPIGDPIEIAALRRVFEKAGPSHRCALGSIKSNLGHLDAAAGVTSLIKAALAVKTGTVAPNNHFERPNPHLKLEDTGFFIPTSPMPWTVPDGPRRASVSSFGLGGTNAHVVLEEPPSEVASGELARNGASSPSLPGSASPLELVLLSARDPDALRESAERLLEFVGANPCDLADVAYTLRNGRAEHRCRVALVASDGTLRETLANAVATPVSVEEPREASAIFVFPGQGSQFPGMARELAAIAPSFADDLRRRLALASDLVGADLLTMLLGEDDHSRLSQTIFAQPALYVVECALAELWMDLGVMPSAMIGHSVGEFAAACMAGVFDFEEGLRLVVARARLVQELSGGAMLAVAAGEQEIVEALRGSCEVAAINGPRCCVLSGSLGTIGRAEKRLAELRLGALRLSVSHAFHSAEMEPAVARFGEIMARARLRPPHRPYVSGTTGTWILPEEATSADYWTRHIRSCVRFWDGIGTLLASTPEAVFVELGPRSALGADLKGAHAGRATVHASLSPRGRGARGELLRGLGELWRSGHPLRWDRLDVGRKAKLLHLPTYPFQRRLHWLAPESSVSENLAVSPVKAERFARTYLPSFRQAPIDHRTRPITDGVVVVVAQGVERERPLLERLAQSGIDFRVIARKRGLGYDEMLRDLSAQLSIETIVHLGAFGSSPGDGTLYEDGFFSVLEFAQALHRTLPTGQVDFLVVTSGALSVRGGDLLLPERAMLSGLCKTLNQDHPGLRCRLLDFEASPTVTEGRCVDALINEIGGTRAEPEVAYRGNVRWTRAFEAFRGEEDRRAVLRDGGVYVILGGWGGVGRAIARNLAQPFRAKLVLLQRSKLPPEEEWEALAQAADHVSFRCVDITKTGDLRAAFRDIEEQHGRIDGIFHAAGVRVAVPATKITRALCREQFLAKVEGLESLREALDETAAGFVVVISSLASVLGISGQGAYAAAHAYCDAFCIRESERSSTAWLSVSCDNWRASTNHVAAGGLPELDPADAMARIDELLAVRIGGHAVLCTRDLDQEHARWVAGPLRVRRGGVPPATAPENPSDITIESRLAALWSEALGHAQIGVHDHFLDLGGDSVVALQLAVRAASLGLIVVPRELIELGTIAAVADAVRARQSTTCRSLGLTRARLTPIQHWFVDSFSAAPSHWNQSRVLVAGTRLDPVKTERTLLELVRRHDALRLRLDAPGWQRVEPEPNFAFRRIETEEAGLPAQVAEVLAQLHSQISLVDGPILACALLDHESTSTLLLVCHHFGIDERSWSLLVEDFARIYGETRESDGAAAHAARPLNYLDWAHAAHDWASSADMAEERAFWSSDLQERRPRLPRDHDGPNTEASSRSAHRHVDEDVVRRLRAASRERRQSLSSILLATLTHVMASYSGHDCMAVDIEGYGRGGSIGGFDVSRTVGWFTSLYRLVLPSGGGTLDWSLVSEIDELGRAVPHGGERYGWFCLAHGQGRFLPADDRPEISFLLLADDHEIAPTLFREVRVGSTPDRDPRAKRPHLLDFVIRLRAEGIELSCIYSEAIHSAQTICGLCDAWVHALGTLAQADARPLVLRTTPLQEAMVLGSYARGAQSILQRSIAISSAVEPELLEAACRKVVEAHDALRVSLDWDSAGRLVQRLAGKFELPWFVVSLAGTRPADVERRRDEILHDETRRCAEQGLAAPLVRAGLILHDAAHSELVWTFNHLVVDGWSISVVINHTLAFYAALRQGHHSTRPCRYRDYLHWLESRSIAQAERVGAAQRMPAAAAFWPPRSDTRMRHSSSAALALDRSTSLALTDGAKAARVTLSVLVNAAWGMLLSRFQNCREVVFGITTAGRFEEVPGVAEVVGLLMNNVPLQLSVDPGSSARSYLTGARTAIFDLREFEWCSPTDFHRLQGLEGVDELFSSLIVVENYPAVEATDGGLTVRNSAANAVSHCPFTVIVDPAESIRLLALYDASRFGPSAVEDILRELARVMTALALEPNATLADIEARETAGYVERVGLLARAARQITASDSRISRCQLRSNGDDRLAFEASGSLSRFALRVLLRDELAEEQMPDAVEVVDDSGPTEYRDEATVNRAELSSTGQRVFDIWTHVLRPGAVRPDDTFIDSGGSSLQLATLLSLLEKASGTRIDILDAATSTFGRLVHLCEVKAMRETANA